MTATLSASLSLVEGWQRPSPNSFLGRIKRHFKAGRILSRLCAYHPRKSSRSELMHFAEIYVEDMGPVSAYAAFQWHVERLNDELRGFGWRVAQHADESYWLEPIE